MSNNTIPKIFNFTTVFINTVFYFSFQYFSNEDSVFLLLYYYCIIEVRKKTNGSCSRSSENPLVC